MPITVKAPKGYITSKERVDQLFYDLMDDFLKINGTSLDNPFIGPNLIGDYQEFDKGYLYAQGKPWEFIAVQLRVPSFSLTTGSQKKRFIAAATDAVLRATENSIPKDRIYVNMIYGDGFWGIGGEFYTDETLLASIETATDE